MAFPNDFVWGAATASYQIEGAALEDGRGECIWTRFSHTPGKVHKGDTGDIACDHYHRYRDDIQLMRWLGLKAYRFSVAWSRVIPAGTGAINEKGIDFYDRLIDGLLEAGIEPFLTLYHWDLPQALQDRGGWANPEIVYWFADYAQVVAQCFGDRVKNWITLNEPWCISLLGYYIGEHAPGLQDLPTALTAAHHLNLSHAAAVHRIRQNAAGAKVGITLNYSHAEPATDRPEDVKAVQLYDGFFNRWYLDPVLKGSYPADLVEHYGKALAGIHLDEVAGAAVPLDFLGLNYYSRALLAADDSQLIPVKYVHNPASEYTEMGWEVYPDGIRQMLLRIQRDYAPSAFYITENGSAFIDPEPQNNLVPDPRRLAYLKAHLISLEQAIAEGVPLKGYFAWSLMDNFEWAFGYSKRFGMIYVDYSTQQRTPKSSAHYYKRVIQANGVVDETD
jgi:beta-glucosidase